MKTAKGYVILETTNWEEENHTYVDTLGNEVCANCASLKSYDPEMVESGYVEIYTDKTFDSRLEAIKVAIKLKKDADAVYRLSKTYYNCHRTTYKVIPVSKWNRVY